MNQQDQTSEENNTQNVNADDSSPELPNGEEETESQKKVTHMVNLAKHQKIVTALRQAEGELAKYKKKEEEAETATLLGEKKYQEVIDSLKEKNKQLEERHKEINEKIKTQHLKHKIVNEAKRLGAFDVEQVYKLLDKDGLDPVVTEDGSYGDVSNLKERMDTFKNNSSHMFDSSHKFDTKNQNGKPNYNKQKEETSKNRIKGFLNL